MWRRSFWSEGGGGEGGNLGLRASGLGGFMIKVGSHLCPSEVLVMMLSLPVPVGTWSQTLNPKT